MYLLFLRARDAGDEHPEEGRKFEVEKPSRSPPSLASFSRFSASALPISKRSRLPVLKVARKRLIRSSITTKETRNPTSKPPPLPPLLRLPLQTKALQLPNPQKKLPNPTNKLTYVVTGAPNPLIPTNQKTETAACPSATRKKMGAVSERR